MLTEDEEEGKIVSTVAHPPHAGSEACDDMVQRLDNSRGTFLMLIVMELSGTLQVTLKDLI